MAEAFAGGNGGAFGEDILTKWKDPEMQVAEVLAEFAGGGLAQARAARAMMRLSVMDWAACALAGVGEPVARILRERALAEAGRADATLIGGGRVPAREAALVNGAISHALDYDDTHFAHIGHPSVAVVPAALAFAERQGADMAAFIDAALIGVEASVRVGLWLGRGHYQIGFHQTATAGAFGACLAAGRLLGLSPAQMGHALGLAATRAAGLKSQFGTMGKPYNAGLAAQTGVEAAELAAAGMISDPGALDGAQGFGPTHAGAGEIGAFDRIGQEFLFEGVSHKFHACCHGTHAAIEALRGLMPVGDDLQEVVITTHSRWMSVCNKPAPESGLEAKFSYRMTAAMVLAGVDTADPESFTGRLCADARMQALAACVEVVADEALSETEANVAVTLADDTVRRGHHDLQAAIPLDVRQARLQAKAASLLGEDRAGALWSAVNAPDLAGLARLLAG